MSNFNDFDDAGSTISEFNSICGKSSSNNIEEELQRLRLENEILRKDKIAKVDVPTWLVSETENVEQQWENFRKAFNRLKESILETKSCEDISGDYREMKKSAELTEAMSSVWISSAEDFKTYLGSLTKRLNECYASKAQKGDSENEMKKEHIKHQEPIEEINMLNATDVERLLVRRIARCVLPPEAETFCDKLVGTMTIIVKEYHPSPWFGDNWNSKDIEPPQRIIIEKLPNGFYREVRHHRSGKKSSSKLWRPDGLRYANNECSFNYNIVETIKVIGVSDTVVYNIMTEDSICMNIKPESPPWMAYHYTIDRT